MPCFFASETESFFHELGLFFRGQGVVSAGNDIDVHCIWVFFGSSERPSRFGLLFLLWFASNKPHKSMVVGVELGGPIVPFVEGGGRVSQIHDLP